MSIVGTYIFLVHGLDILVLNCPKGPDQDILEVQNESKGARAQYDIGSAGS